MMYSILSMSSKDLKCELLDFFNFEKDTPTVSAFIQQRNKISFDAFEYLFHQFTQSFSYQKLYKGYCLLAVDGSNLHSPSDSKEEDCFYPRTNEQKQYNLMYLNAMYDLMNNIYQYFLYHSIHLRFQLARIFLHTIPHKTTILMHGTR